MRRVADMRTEQADCRERAPVAGTGHRPERRHRRLAGCAVAFVAVACAACGWESLDALTLDNAAADASIADGAAVAVHDATTRDSDASGDETEVDRGGQAPPADAPAEEVVAAPSSAPCAAAGPYVEQWTFDSTVQSWYLAADTGVDGSVVWTSSTGNPSPGALQVDVTPPATDASSTNGVWLQVDGSYGDFSGKTVAAWIWLDSGPSPQLKVFTQSNPQYGWEDNGTLTLPARAWTCVSLPVSTPSYEQAWFDPTDVIRVGFEMLSASPFRVYVDSVHVQ